MNRNEIIKILEGNKKVLVEQYGVVKIGLFGSYSFDQQNEESDIDIAIEMIEEKKNIHNFLALKRYLEQELGKKVDLGFEHCLKPAVKNHVESQLIYV